MATVYLVHTNGIQHMRTYTSKGKAVETAESMRTSAESMTGRNIITVTTQARGKEVYRWESPSVPASAPTVEIQGEYTEAEDAHAHIAEQTAWMTQEGVCVGLCAIGTGCEHCDAQYGPVEPETAVQSDECKCSPSGDKSWCPKHYPAPVLADGMDTRFPITEEPAKTETVCVVQNWAGTVGVNHYHAPGCRDIEREAKRFGARDGLGMYSYSFSSVADILTHEYADICEDAAEMISEANSDYAGIKIMPCLSIPAGRMEGSPLVTADNFFRLGFDQPSPERVAEIRAEIDAHECDDAECITRTVRDMNREDNDPGNAGFVETQDVEPLAEWEKELLEGVENSRSTGVTQHSITSAGKQWESFQHVLNAGDIVRVAGMQGVYEVHCLIPGLPTVYVLGTLGEPFPVSATATYAI